MNRTAIKEKFLNIEAELEFLKKALLKEPDFEVDEKNWRLVGNDMKKIREKIYRRRYGKA